MMADKTALLKPGVRGDWRTPKEFYANLNELFHFTFDPCPDWEGKPRRWDGLAVNWNATSTFISKDRVQKSPVQTAYVNPPFGPQVGLWLAKALQEEQERGVGSVFLLPARTDTRWWHDLVMPNFTMLGFVKGRLHFDDCPVPAPFPCVLVRFGHEGPDCYGVQTFDARGHWLEQCHG